MGPETDSIKNKAQCYLSKEMQLLDIKGVVTLVDSERPIAQAVLHLALMGIAVRLCRYQYTKANLVKLLKALQDLHASLMFQKRYDEAENTLPLIQEVQHIQRSGYEYRYPRK